MIVTMLRFWKAILSSRYDKVDRTLAHPNFKNLKVKLHGSLNHLFRRILLNKKPEDKFDYFVTKIVPLLFDDVVDFDKFFCNYLINLMRWDQKCNYQWMIDRIGARHRNMLKLNLMSSTHVLNNAMKFIDMGID